LPGRLGFFGTTTDVVSVSICNQFTTITIAAISSL
jgi:hypothetical protein